MFILTSVRPMIGSGGACGNFAQGDDLVVSLEKSRRGVPTSRWEIGEMIARLLQIFPLDVAATALLLNAALRALRAMDCTIIVRYLITTRRKLSMIDGG